MEVIGNCLVLQIAEIDEKESVGITIEGIGGFESPLHTISLILPS